MFLLPQVCLERGQRFLGSVVRWAAEVIFRVIGFIEAFVRSFIKEDVTCVGPNCDADPDSKEESYKGVQQSELGKMMVILLSIPIDLLIGDREVACTTVCRSFFAVPAPRLCECWNWSPRYGNRRNGNDGLYEWTTDLGVCATEGLENKNTIEHIGTLFQNTTGCCVLNALGQSLPLNERPTSPRPTCQSPHAIDVEYFNRTESFGFNNPGSCVYLTACRADNLPSCADDREVPPALAGGYTGAVDGIVMGLLRYLQCILSNIFCDASGKCVELGLLFFPARLIFSISWQILGGVIKFIVASILFFFSLFSPPQDGGCSCYEQVESTFQSVLGSDPPQEVRLTRFFKKSGLLCYHCNTLESKCFEKTEIDGNPNCRFQKRCASYCPIYQYLRDTSIDATTAFARCVADYNNENVTKIMNTLTATEACSGHIAARNYRVFDDSVVPNPDCWEEAINITTPTTGLCQPGRRDPPPGLTTCKKQTVLNTNLTLGPTVFTVINAFPATNDRNFFQHDACPDPDCQYNAPARTVCGQTSQRGWWNCGTYLFKDHYPGSPRPGCGAIQILQNFLGVFRAFVDIFGTPLIIPTKSGGSKRSEGPFDDSMFAKFRKFSPYALLDRASKRFMGPVRRESRQMYKKRLIQKHREYGTRGDEHLYLITTDVPGTIEESIGALFDYDTSDCWTDMVNCSCRNFEMSEECEYDDATQQVRWSEKRRSRGTAAEMTTEEMTAYIAETRFTGDSVCDHIIQSCAGKDWDTMINMDEKNMYMDCIEKRLQGERAHLVNDMMPADIMYNPHAVTKMTHNILHRGKKYIERRAQEYKRQSLENLDRRNKLKAEGKEKDDPNYLPPLREKYPNLINDIIERRKVAGKILETQLGIYPDNLMYDALIRADIINYKYSNGYYGHMLRLAGRNIMDGSYAMPTTQEALSMMREAVDDLRRTIPVQPYREVIESTANATGLVSRYVGDVMEEGVFEHVSRVWKNYKSYRSIKFDSRDIRHTDSFVKKIQQGALYQWYNNTYGGGEGHIGKRGEETRWFAPFRDHMIRTVEFQRRHWNTTSFSVFNADLKFWGLSDIMFSRFKNGPQWTQENLDAIERVKRLYYQVYNRIWPGHLSKEIQERFLFLGNCQVLDRALDITTKVVDYCVNEAMPNMKRFDSDDNSLFRYMRTTSMYRNDTYYSWSNRHRFEERPTAPRDPRSWIRPQLLRKNATRNPLLDVDYRTYRLNREVGPHHFGSRNLTDPYAHGPANFNFFSWLLRLAENLLEFSLGAESDMWFEEIQKFLTNPNTDISLYPDVGLLYWLRFSFVCNFPENLNCSIGEGVETALLWTTVGFIGVAVVGTYILPLIMIPFYLIGFGFAFLLVFAAVAFHYPSSCMFMFPSFPIPVGAAVPQCIADALIEFADKWITDCYSPLIIPPYMIAGELCPANPMQKIDILNCRDVGVSDGIQNILYLGFWLFGSGFCDIMIQLSGTVIGAFIPGMQRYLVITLNDFKMASDTQMQRFTFCFWATIPTLLTPLLFIFLGGLFLAALVVPLVLLVNSLIEAFMTSPIGGAIPGVDDSAWVGEHVDSQPPPIEEPMARPLRSAYQVQRPIASSSPSRISYLGQFMNLFGRPRKVKNE